MTRWLLVALLLPGSSAAAIHARIAADGRLEISALPQQGSRPFVPRGSRTVRPVPPVSLRTLFDEVAAETGTDAALLHAVAAHESAYDPRAVSPAGAVGLMQLMPATARRFGVTDRFDAAQNLRGGAAYLALLIQRFGDLSLALAAYNAGEGAVQRHGNRVPPFPETQAYVRAVLAAYARGHSQDNR